MSKERNSVLVLHDDGSLQVFSYMPALPESGGGMPGGDGHIQTGSLEADQVKKLGAALLGSRANYGGAPPVFPLDFFEKTTCITADVKLGGDILRNSDSEGVKLCLQAEEGFLEGPSVSGFKVLILLQLCSTLDEKLGVLSICSILSIFLLLECLNNIFFDFCHCSYRSLYIIRTQTLLWWVAECMSVIRLQAIFHPNFAFFKDL